MAAANTTTLQRLLDDASLQRNEVYAELLLRACDRLRVLAGKRLRGFPALRRWVETDDERAVVDCLFLSELTQEETAHVLGVSPRTVKRRWQSARIRLQAAIEEEACPHDR